MSLLSELPKCTYPNPGWPWEEETDPGIYDKNIQWPRISIVTPSYNQGRFIEETIRSVLLQNYPDLEYIIIDGGSKDNTVETIRRYERWITYWVSEDDHGQSDAINKGLRVCSGEIFNWLNSDDFLEKDALYHIAYTFCREDVDIVGGRERRFGDSIIPVIHPGTSIFPSLEQTVLFGHNVQPATFFLTKKVREIGIDGTLHYMMDSDLFTRYLLKYGLAKILKINPIISNFRFHDTSKTISKGEDFESERWAIRWGIGRHFTKAQDELFLSFNRYYSPLASIRNFIVLPDFCERDFLYYYLKELAVTHKKKGDLRLVYQCYYFLWKNHMIDDQNTWQKIKSYLKFDVLPESISIKISQLKRSME